MFTFKITRPYNAGTASRPGLPFHAVTFAGKTFTATGEVQPATDAELDYLKRVVASRVVRHSPDGRGTIEAASTFDRNAAGELEETPVSSFKPREGDEPLSRFIEVRDEAGNVLALD